MSYRPIEDRDSFDIENSFYLRSEPYRLGKMLSQYEIYRKIVALPGAVVECGTFKGVSLTRLATFRHLLENDDVRQIVAFDAFGSFPQAELTRDDDRKFAAIHDAQSGGQGIDAEDLTHYFKEKGFRNFRLIAGDVRETLDAFLRERTNLRVALLHLDMDVYEPTRIALEKFWPRLVSGAIVMVDDYGTQGGASTAIDEFCGPRSIPLLRGAYYQKPTFFLKP